MRTVVQCVGLDLSCFHLALRKRQILPPVLQQTDCRMTLMHPVPNQSRVGVRRLRRQAPCVNAT